jgi:hypothetical protein
MFWYGDRGWGSAVILALVATPVIVVLVVFLMAAERVATAHRLIDTSADNAARAAAEAVSAPAARVAAHQAVTDVLSGHKLVCVPLTVAVDTSDWGKEGTVAVTVRCAAQLGSLSPTRVGRSATFSAHAVSVIDTARQTTATTTAPAG